MFDPPVPPETAYTPFYCEENIYLLCQAFISRQEDVSAVFISNENKTVALWNQKLREGSVVVWDYHVVLLLRSKDQQHWIYDFDTRLPFPCLMKDYLALTFQQDVPSLYQSLFRVVPGATYIEKFASDRSHMQLTDENESNPQTPAVREYRSPPPHYPPIRGKDATGVNNLMSSFVCMVSSDETFGNVENLQGMMEFSM